MTSIASTFTAFPPPGRTGRGSSRKHEAPNTATVEVPLTEGEVAVVDRKDHAIVAPYKWFLRHGEAGSKHAVTKFKTENGDTEICMHRMLMPAPESTTIDHVDGNGLNNTRMNLSASAGNKLGRGNSEYRGVYFDGGGGNWQKPWAAAFAGIGKSVRLGRFATAELAAAAYDDAAREKHGEFARLNFPGGYPGLGCAALRNHSVESPHCSI
jgi:hypothetical protein